MRVILVVLLALLASSAEAQAQAPVNFLYMSSGDLPGAEALLARPDIAGAQVIYNWRALEPEKGQYDFSAIEADLAIAEALHKELFIQIQDRFFSVKARNVPDYVLEGAAYGGGLVPQIDDPEAASPETVGWTTVQWNAAVRQRFQALLEALAVRFDGRLYGLNLPETSIELDPDADNAGFSCDAYFAAEMENAAFARSVFDETHVVQYVNFWPCEWNNDHDYMGRFFAFAAENGIGLGGPDIAPNRRGQMKNSYPFFNQYRDRLDFVAMAIQEPTLAYVNDATGKPYTREEFVAFATDYLGVDVIFWSLESPWLKD